MGIKGIYSQIGAGERIALSRFAVEHYEKHSRPLKLAIDISIWNFQVQSGKGGQNPVLRTLYYRLLRLLSLAIRPLFVFDGPHKPPFKRNKKTGNHAASLPDYLTKQLLKQFGFPFLTAPGEAEAECALLQRNGIVDAVLSEDVDTLMFGCEATIRNWSSEGTKGNKSPTHVNLYRVDDTTQKSGIDSKGMILVALMSGGDYIPEGIPGCGVKTACEAARAGFGKDLCKLSEDDPAGCKEWRDWLQHELHTNESGHFRQRHKTLIIPDNFPRMDILRYYTHPTVSTSEKINRLSLSIEWDKAIDVHALRRFVAEAFEWVNRSGAVKFVRGLAPALLIHHLQAIGADYTTRRKNTNNSEPSERPLVAAVCGRRMHFITDGLPELRLAYIPIDICRLDLELEDIENHTEQAGSDTEAENAAGDEQSEVSTTAQKDAPSRYNPSQPERLWVLETFAKVGAPLLVETWEEDQRNPRKFATRKARERKQVAKGGMKHGALNSYVKLTKPGLSHQQMTQPAILSGRVSNVALIAEPNKATSKTTTLEETDHTPTNPWHQSHSPRNNFTGHVTTKAKDTRIEKRTKLAQSTLTDSWTPSRRPSNTLNAKLPRGTRYSALGIYSSGSKDDTVLDDHEGFDENSHDNAKVTPEPPASPSRKATPPLSNLSLDCNVTVRRKRKAKPLTKAFTAPCVLREVIDLDSSDEGLTAGTVDRPAEQLGLLSQSIARPASSQHAGLPRRQSISTQEDRRIENQSLNSRKADEVQHTPFPPTSPASSLPWPSELRTALMGAPADSQGTAAKTSSALKSPSRARKAREHIMLRDSLEGAWRKVDPLERARPSARVFSSVEIVDLTSD